MTTQAAKLSGKSGRVKVGAVATISTIAVATGIATITTAAAHGFIPGCFVLHKNIAGITDLNNGGKGMLVLTAPTPTTYTVAVTTSQTNATGGTAQRIIPITEWTLKASIPTSDSSDSESVEWANKEFTGLKEWSGSYDGYDRDGRAMALLGVKAAVELDVDANNYYSGTALFKDWDTGAKLKGDLVTVKGSFDGDGELTKTFNASPVQEVK